MAMTPAVLPAELIEPAAFDFRRVALKGVFRHDLELLYGATARRSVLGQQILTPLIRKDGSVVLVDRGWVPADKVHPASRPQAQFEGEVMVSGIARYRAADRPGLFTPDNDPVQNHWYHYDLEAMSEALGMELSPIVVEADDTPNPGGLPVGGGTRVTLTNNHLQYAVTWYGLAACLIGVYIVFRRQQKPSR